MSLPAIKEYVLDSLRQQLSPIKVAWVGGAFGGDELKRHIMDAPVVLVSILSLSEWARVQTPSGFRCNADAQCAAYVVARGENRDSETLEIIPRLLTAVYHLSNFDVGYRMQGSQKLSAQNLYSGQVDGLAIALWGTQWDASISIITEG